MSDQDPQSVGGDAPIPPHILTPHARPLQPIPVAKDGQQFVALRDPTMLVAQSMVVPPQALNLIQLFQGELSIDQMTEKFVPADKVPDETQRAKALAQVRAELVGLATNMDKFGLLWGPTFEDYERQRSEKLAEAGAFPPQASASLVGIAQQEDSSIGQPPADAAERAAWATRLSRQLIDQWLADAEDPELETPAVGLVVPHLDYMRGAEVYASAYRAWSDAPTPDRVVILGTNHFGAGDGIVASQYGFETTIGRVRADEDVIRRLGEQLGDRLFKDQLDLAAEHSIELHLPWIQQLFGDVPVVAALIPDPLVPMIADDGERVSRDEFINTLRGVLDEVGGTTYYVSSADLSHVGPQFGEPKKVDDTRRLEVEQHDREMMTRYLDNDPGAFIEAMEWSKNPTRWCSIGNMSAVAELAGADEIELLDYRQACDEEGNCLVSIASMALTASAKA